jgi:hypothetical protein
MDDNTQRTHRAHPGHTTPQQAYHARPKAQPTNQASAHFRVRHDIIDQSGKLTLRHGRLHHLGIGITHAHNPVLILVAATTVTVISKTNDQVLSGHHIDPDKNYRRNQNKNPGRWPRNL